MDLSSLPISKSADHSLVAGNNLFFGNPRRIAVTVPSPSPVFCNKPFAGKEMNLISEGFMPIIRNKGFVEFVFRQGPIKTLMEKTGVVKEVLGFAHGKSPLRFSRYLRSPLQVVSKSGDKLMIHPAAGVLQ